VPRCYTEDNWCKSSEIVLRESVRRRLSEPVGNKVRAEAEESPLLEAVTRERPVKTQQTGKT
jgi:hypothetical protein